MLSIAEAEFVKPKGKLIEWLNSFEHAMEFEGGRELDAETLRNLRALGYID
jgi:hypothetical protein